MSFLDSATREELSRLLQLFPVSHVRQAWPSLKAKAKADLCDKVAQTATAAQIVAFVADHFSCTKQHVYILTAADGKEPSLPGSILDGALVASPNQSQALFLSRHTRGVLLVDPVERTSISFLWPVLVEIIETYVVVRFVVLEKHIAAYFQRTAYPAERGSDERELLASLLADISTQTADLHKGVRGLWATDYMDAHASRYKTAKTSVAEAMHDDKGIKAHNSELYEKLRTTPLGAMLFRVGAATKSTVDTLSIDPTNGTLGFHKYSETVGDTDRVIRAILEGN